MKKILVIEDEESLRNNVCEILGYEGFDILEAANGLKGLQLANEKLPDLILCDIMMPVMDGYEVLAAIRENQETRLIPFILLTAMAEREDIRRGMELGADDYIVKPFSIQELLQSVNSRLKKSEAVKEYAETALEELRNNLIIQLPHELRTPLNSILGFGQLLRDNPESFSTGEISEYGKIICSSGQRLYRMIQNYLIYAQLELKNSQAPFNLVLTGAGLICRQVAEEVASRYDRMNDLLVFASEGTVHADQNDFVKVVEELADNAFKFSELGSKVMVSCGAEDDRFLLTVTDKGRGMAPADIQRIGAYMQFDRMLHAQQGSGLGMIISKKIVEMYGGEVDIESETGTGTRVRVWFPGG